MSNIKSNIKELFLYGIFGVLTTIINIVTFKIFQIFIRSYELCNVLAWFISVLFAFITNKKFVFNSKSNDKKELISFFISRIISLLVELVLLKVFIEVFYIDVFISKIIVNIIVIILNFISSKIIVFK